jgi:hypothetical protein
VVVARRRGPPPVPPLSRSLSLSLSLTISLTHTLNRTYKPRGCRRCSVSPIECFLRVSRYRRRDQRGPQHAAATAPHSGRTANPIGRGEAPWPMAPRPPDAGRHWPGGPGPRDPRAELGSKFERSAAIRGSVVPLRPRAFPTGEKGKRRSSNAALRALTGPKRWRLTPPPPTTHTTTHTTTHRDNYTRLPTLFSPSLASRRLPTRPSFWARMHSRA